MYVKLTEGQPTISVRLDATLMDIDIDVIAQMNIDLDIRRQWDHNFETLKTTETLSETEDYTLQELKLPFPLSNREFIVHRCFINNKLHPAEIERLGLWQKKNKYWIILQTSIETTNIPLRKNVVRGSLKTALVIEQDSDDPRKSYYRMISQTDLKGNVPLWALKQGGGRSAAKILNETIQAYHKNAKKWKKIPFYPKEPKMV